MENPRVFKRPERADVALQASLLAELRNSPPPAPTAKDDDAADEEEQAHEPRRFETGTPVHTITLRDGDVEYCADVVDASSERVWYIAVWPNPPEAQGLPDAGVSHCFVIGSKNEARDRLAAMTDGPTFVAKKQAHAGDRGTRAAGFEGNVTRRGTRVQQKQG